MGLFNDVGSNSEYAASNDSTVSEYWLEKDAGGSGRGRILALYWYRTAEGDSFTDFISGFEGR
jgi:hypothetical protein